MYERIDSLVGNWFGFFFGIAMDHTRWSMTDALMVFPCLIGVVLLWPFGLLNLVIRGFHGQRIPQPESGELAGTSKEVL